MLKGKKILIGVCGGIAAYKVCNLIRELKREEAEVKVMMTPAATQFVTPLTFSTLSGNEVSINLFPENTQSNTDYSVNHIRLSLWAELIVIAPATANTLAKISCGIADNLLTSIILAARSPVVLAPSMDLDMYENRITQENLQRLKSLGYHIIEPESGQLASGLSGKGRLPETKVLMEKIKSIFFLEKPDLKGKKILITAGPTQENIDPVRYISNRSSGKMGYALCEAAKARGAVVTLISGQVMIPKPDNIEFIPAVSSDEMFEKVKNNFSDKDIIIMAAAVADFKPSIISKDKIKKDKLSSSIEITQTKDILKFLGENKKHQLLIGFAVETLNGIQYAKEKLKNKNLDLIILNNPNEPGAGFNVDTNIITMITKDGSMEKTEMKPKSEIAHIILDKIASLF